LTKKDTKITIFSGFVGIVFTAIYDVIKSKPILSTFWNGLKWIWKNIFEFELTVWQVLLGFGVLILILYLLSLRNSDGVLENGFDWRSYNKDRIHNMSWSWYWDKNPLDGKWNVKDLKPICNSCGTKMHFDNSSWSSVYAECPRCESKYHEQKDLTKIESVIIDNVQRGIYPKDIQQNN